MAGDAHIQPEESSLPEVVMAVPQEAALRQIEIEAMRGILDNLRRINDQQIEQTKALHSIDKRLVRVEESKISTEVVELKAAIREIRKDLEILKEEKTRREGAVGLVEWVFKHWPGAVGFILVVILILRMTGQIKL